MLLSFKRAMGAAEEAPAPEFDCKVGQVKCRPSCFRFFRRSFLQFDPGVCWCDIEAGGKGAEKDSQRPGGGHSP